MADSILCQVVVNRVTGLYPVDKLFHVKAGTSVRRPTLMIIGSVFIRQAKQAKR